MDPKSDPKAPQRAPKTSKKVIWDHTKKNTKKSSPKLKPKGPQYLTCFPPNPPSHKGFALNCLTFTAQGALSVIIQNPS